MSMPGRCPKCQHDNLVYVTEDYDGEVVEYGYVCKECGFEGVECYNLEFAGHTAIDDPEGKFL